jgi:hypothetical protein
MKRFALLLCLAPAPALSIAQAQPAQSDSTAKYVPPKLLKKVQAKFPRAAPLGHHIVIVNLIVETTGIPSHVRIVRSDDPVFNENSILAAEKYRFAPATRDGHPVTAVLGIEVEFNSYQP